MVILILVLLGLCLGSFVNALVFRVHEKQGRGQRAKSKHSLAYRQPGPPAFTLSPSNLSIWRGRSMCPHCKHILSALDLVPVFSWLSLGGKCRYCHKKIDDNPLVEVITPLLFVLSYVYWPFTFDSKGIFLFCFWLVFLIGLIALAVYDIRWFLLPNKIVYTLITLALIQLLVLLLVFHGGFSMVLGTVYGVLIGGGIFYALFQLSGGKWIGGGDVKLGTLLGLLIGGPAASLLMIFLASCLGTVIVLPLLATGKATKTSKVPFGPFLIISTIIVRLFSQSIIMWYKHQFLLF